jgi:hypothetical protein
VSVGLEGRKQHVLLSHKLRRSTRRLRFDAFNVNAVPFKLTFTKWAGATADGPSGNYHTYVPHRSVANWQERRRGRPVLTLHSSSTICNLNMTSSKARLWTTDCLASLDTISVIISPTYSTITWKSLPSGFPPAPVLMAPISLPSSAEIHVPPANKAFRLQFQLRSIVTCKPSARPGYS